MLSHIQNQILTLLLRSNGLSYSECIPAEVDKDLFNYHFKFLQDKGYVEKIDDRYFLTDFGKKYVQQLDAMGQFKSYFRFSVLAYVKTVVDKNECVLMHKRSRHPYFGDIATVSGKVLYGESIETAAGRKLKEETGLECSNFKLVGVNRKIRKDKDEKIIEDTLYHCCFGSDPSGKLISDNEFGENSWMTFRDAQEQVRNNITFHQHDVEILNRLEKNNYEFFYWQDEMNLESF